MVYRLVKYKSDGKLYVLHGLPDEGTIIHVTEVYPLAETFQNKEIEEEYLSNRTHQDFTENSIIIVNGLAYLNK